MAKLLKYVGPGFVPGVPAADHECEDEGLARELVAGGAYEYADESPADRRAREKAAKAAKAEANAKAAAIADEQRRAAEKEAAAAVERAAALEARAGASASAAEALIEEVRSGAN